MHICVCVIVCVSDGVLLTENIFLLSLVVIKVFAITDGHHVFWLISMGAFLLGAGTKGEQCDLQCGCLRFRLLVFL